MNFTDKKQAPPPPLLDVFPYPCITHKWSMGQTGLNTFLILGQICLNVHLKIKRKTKYLSLMYNKVNIWLALASPPQSVLRGRWYGFHHSNTRFKIQHAHVPVWLHLPVVHTHKPCTHSVHVPAQLAIGIAISANVLLWSPEKHEEQKKIRHHMLFLAKPYKVKVWHSDGSYAGWGGYTGTLLSRGDATFERVMKKRWRFPSQSQPLSFIMWDSSMINFPSLYFWLSSKACSCRGEDA